MSSFSERQGLLKPREVFQLNSLDIVTRTKLYNVCTDYFLNPYSGAGWGSAFYAMAPLLGHDFFHKIKSSYSVTDAGADLQQCILREDWNRVFDLLEFIAQRMAERESKSFITACNRELKMELSAYRFVGDEIAPITSSIEIDEIEQALSGGISPVQAHISAALELLSQRPTPDLRNSIKESISAVEAACGIVAGAPRATLGEALKKLERGGVPLHPALLSGFDKLYGWTSAADGIRHALTEDASSTLSLADAKFMLVACSAFVNYLLEKSQA